MDSDARVSIQVIRPEVISVAYRDVKGFLAAFVLGFRMSDRAHEQGFYPAPFGNRCGLVFHRNNCGQLSYQIGMSVATVSWLCKNRCFLWQLWINRGGHLLACRIT